MEQVPDPGPPEASPAVTTEAKPKRKKGPLRTGFLIVLLVAVVIVVGSIELFSGDLVRVALTSGAVASTGARVEVKGASASLLGGSLELRDLAVAPYADTKDSVLTAKTADAEVELGKLLTGLVHVPALTLSDGQISLVRDKNGRLNLDPGPPPGGEPEASPEQTKDRDLVQEVGDIIERYKKYHEYYEKVHSTKSKESEQKKEKEERKTYPGMASYLPPIEQLQPRFWLKKMGALNLSLTSLDERTGKPFLPEFESLSFMMENLSSNEALTGQPFKLAVAAKPKNAGQWNIQYASPPGEGVARQLMFSLDDVKVADVAKLVAKSMPFDFEDGTFSLRSIAPPPAQDGTTKVKAEPGFVALDLENVLGAIQLDLSKIKLKAAPGKDKILGVPAPTFLQAFNYAADQVPLSLQFGVSGSTSRPKFELLNSAELLTTLRDQVANSASAQLKALGDSLKAGLESELARNKDSLLDKGKALLEGKADPKDVKKSLQESLKDPQLKSTIDDAKSQLDGLFGKKKKDKKKDEPKKDGG